MLSRRAQSAALVSLGAWLACRGALAVAGLGLTALLGVGAAFSAFFVSRASAALLPNLAATVIAWGGGASLAFGVAMQAVRSDREQGVLALLRARGATQNDYVRGRVGGLVAVLAVAVGGSILLACLAALAATRGAPGLAPSCAGAVAYGLAFAATIGPIAMATLGAHSRLRGYASFVAVLVVPELAAGWTAGLLPEGWHELTSIPDALAAIRAGVAHPTTSGAAAARACIGLFAVVAVALFFVATSTRRRGADGAP